MSLLAPETPELAARQSAAIERLRWPLAAAVVMVHSFGQPAAVSWEGGGLASLTAADAFNLVRTCCSRVLPSVAVPAFFFVAGLLFFRGAEPFTAALWLRKLRRRARSLLLPYVAWNALALALYAWRYSPPAATLAEAARNFAAYFERKGGWSVFLCSHPVGRDGTGWLGQPVYHLSAPIDVPLWFVRELIILALLAPAVRALLRRFGARALLPLFAAYALPLWPPLRVLSATAAFFFSAGAWFSLRGVSAVALFRKWRAPCAALALSSGALLLLCPPAGLPAPPLAGPVFACAAVPLAFLLALPRAGKPAGPCLSFLARTSFFLYASHTVLLLSAADRRLAELLPGGDAASRLARYLLAPALAICAATGLYLLLRALCPALLRLLTGGRKL